MENKLNKIVEEAYKIFIENGIRNISMDDLCRIIGISKKTLYRVVENKADLLDKMGDYINSQIRERIEEVSGMNLNAIDVLLEMSKITSENHVKINPIITFEFRKYYPQVYEKYLSTKKELIVAAVKKNLEQGIKEELYRQNLNVEIVAHLYFNKIEEFHNLNREEIADFSYAKIFEVMFENHIRGISNENGIAYFEKQKEKLNFNITQKI